MSTKPILFNTEMVKAILEGRKTVTRRIIKRDLLLCCDFDTDGTICGCHDKDGDWYEIEDFSPYQIDDILYVRETWNRGYFETSDAEGDTSQWFEEYHQRDGGFCDATSHYIYRADFTPKEEVEYGVEVKDGVYKMPWKPSIHMPKEAARIWLKVTNVRVERLQDMKTDDYLREGFTANDAPDWWNIIEQKFRKTWNSTIKKQDLDKYGWDANPYTWVYEFERIENEN